MLKWAQYAAIFCLLASAVYLRVDGLTEPNYWYDEAISSLRVAGHSERQVAAFAEAHPTFPISELESFVRVDGSTTIRDTVESLKSEDVQHPPLFYVSARAWVARFGNSIEAVRAFSTLWSILALAAMYWLCLELFVKSGAFESQFVCWLGVLAMALSPYQLALGKEYRPYSMWIFWLTLACALFLRAVRKNTPLSWLFYAAAITVSFYTQLLTAFALAASGVFLLALERFRFTRRMGSFLAAALVAILAWMPWVLIVLDRQKVVQSDLSWVEYTSHGRFQFRYALEPFLLLADLSFWDLKNLWALPGYVPIMRIAELGPMLALPALWFFTPRPRRFCTGFAIAMIVSVSATLFVMDFYTGGTSGYAFRYDAPSNLGWLLILALALAALSGDLGRWNVLGRTLASGVVLVGTVSAVLSHDAHHTWNKAFDQHGEVIESLNANGRAALVTDDFVGAILMLLPQVRPDLLVSWHARCYSCDRVLTPILDIPFPPPASKETYFFRSWTNTPTKQLIPLLDRLMADQLDDPRFHTAPVQLSKPSYNFFLLTPR